MRAWAGEKPISTSMATCSCDGSGADEPDPDAWIGASISAGEHRFSFSCIAREEPRRTGVFHVLEEPLHRSLRVAVPGSQERLLAPNRWEAHPLELGHRCFVELRKGGGPWADDEPYQNSA